MTRKREIIEPPLYAGSVQGIRTWRMVPDTRSEGLLLAALAQNVVWTPGEPVRAICLAAVHSRGHISPAPDCSCGIYAHHPSGRQSVLTLERVLASDSNRIAGVVSAWGHIEVHLDGFRAEKAVPDSFLYRSLSARAYALDLASLYGAKAVHVPDLPALRAFCRTLSGIPPSQVSDHIISRA